MKPGPGVSKDEPQKKRFFLFFDVLFRKFWKICQLNFIYIIFWIPFAIGLFTLIVGGLNIFSILIMLFSSIITGPATAGATLVLRNFSREEHSFVLSDFWDALKGNLKNAAVWSFIYTFLTLFVILAVWFYSGMLGSAGWAVIPMALVILSGAILSFMNFHIYTIMVTFNMPFKAMVKNSFIFSVLGVLTNILTLFLVLALGVLMVLFFPVTILLIVTFVPTLMLFIITFNAYPRIYKYMIEPANMKAAEEKPDEPEDEDRVFSDKRLLPEDKPK